MKRVLVTGATGFVGANLTRRLLELGHEVHLLVRPNYRSWRIAGLQDRVRIHQTELHEPASVLGAVREAKPDWVFHLAVSGAYSWQTDLQEMMRTNIQGTINLLSACLDVGFEAMVNVGSSSEYGFKKNPPMETEALEPNSHYAVTKAAATLFCQYSARSGNVRIPTLRLYSVFGPLEDPGRLIPTLITYGLRGALPPLVNPDVARDFIYVDDVVEACLLAAQHTLTDPGAIFNVGSATQTTLRHAVEVARRLMRINPEPVWGSMPNRIWDSTSWISDNTRIRKELGWQPRHSFEQGFEKTLDWFRRGPPPEYSVSG